MMLTYSVMEIPNMDVNDGNIDEISVPEALQIVDPQLGIFFYVMMFRTCNVMFHI